MWRHNLRRHAISNYAFPSPSVEPTWKKIDVVLVSRLVERIFKRSRRLQLADGMHEALMSDAVVTDRILGAFEAFFRDLGGAKDRR